MMDVATARQHDLRVACIHEHAHAAVAAHFSIPGRVTIMENSNGSPDPDGLTYFRGTFERYVDGDVHQLRMIGLAGTVAEEFDSDSTIEAWEVVERLQLGLKELSATDAELAGDYTEANIEECLAMVRSLWPDIALEAKFEAATWEALASP